MRDEGHLGEEIINMYLDGELSAGERGHVEAHLAACDECQAEVAALRQLFIALDELVPAPAPDLVPGVLARVQPRRRSRGPGLLRSRPLWLVPALQAAAAVALLAWGWTRLIGYWTVVVGALSLGTPGEIWVRASGWVTIQWSVLSTWATAQWATLPTWCDVHWWFARLPAFDGSHLSPIQLAVLGVTLVVLWVVGNAVLLRRALLNGQVTQRRH